MLNLSRRGHITQDERFDIAEMLQLLLLNETARAAKWRLGDAAFHGGTSLKLVHGSPRFSEDLDFMVATKSLDALYKSGPAIAENLRSKVSVFIPGSIVEFGGNRGEGEERIDVWKVKWTHPQRIGKVLVKMEFYATRPELLADYSASMVVPVAPGNVVRVTTTIPVSDILSLWADKVKAVATRPAFKWRDAFDLAFISRHFANLANEAPDGDARRIALTRTASIYGKSLEDVAAGLTARMSEGDLDDVAVFTENMKLWLPPDIYESWLATGEFGRMLRVAKHEVEYGLSLATPAFGVGAVP